MAAISPGRVLRHAVRWRWTPGSGAADLAVFVGRVFYHLVTDIARGRYFRTVLRQISDIVAGVGAIVVGLGMVFVIFFMSFFTGTTVGLQAIPGLQRIGAQSLAGLIASYANVREITPIIAGIALVFQLGASFTAEIGAMRISEEIDALEVMGINALAYLVCTRLVATLAALIPLYLIALFSSFFATRLISVQFFGISPGVYDYYFHLYLPPIDVFYSVVKVVVFAFIIVIVHCYRGFQAVGGPVGVGHATGQAIRESMVSIIMVNLLLSYIFWGHGGTVSLTG
ncbi:MAG: phospholipid/cholesterol/gamma-HCH transport system permease protein [Streptosporangiaceae bacterium]|jgi:phospholipid/cholesterol/gamma-HCH transport system permease protein|nr:transporter permease [Streptosporangiaceae bacterium]MDX6296067.1 phospholipid/cholesterol/gamma-HCH transport system permease protein [Kribbellaceae bacterium]MDX6430310.1 phospholipid/cholesterol/gamma-HCH transport system permease protein [Streptosporangiaceae bacterium]